MDITLTATVDVDGLTIRQSIRGGVDGPICSIEFDGSGRPELDEVEQMIRAEGFERAGSWVLGNSYRGLYLEAPLIRR